MTYKEKQCVVCGKLFIPNSGIQICCSNECSKEYKKEYDKQLYIKNKEYYKERNKQWMENNKEYFKEYNKKYYQENKERYKERYEQYREKTKNVIKKKQCVVCGKLFIPNSNNQICCSEECSKERGKEYNRQYSKQYRKKHIKQRKRTDPNYKMLYWCRQQLHRCLASKKTKHTFDILDYTPDELRLHLGSKFKEDMSWDNHGTLWHIDHIKPLCSFNFINEDGTPNYDVVREANSLDNLQPLYVEENLSKGGYYDEAC